MSYLKQKILGQEIIQKKHTFPWYQPCVYVLSTAECNNRLPCSARLVYSSQYKDQKVRHVVYSAQYVILKSK